MGVQWLSGRVLDSRPRGGKFKPHRPHCVVSLSKNINPSLVLVQTRKTGPFITERLLMGRKESNQTKKLSNSGMNFKLEVVSVTWHRYIEHFFCLALETGLSSYVVECLPVDPATINLIPSWSRLDFFCSLRHVKQFRSN